MEFDIKQEPADYETANSVSESLLTSCCLCPEGLKLLNKISEHFVKVHRGKSCVLKISVGLKTILCFRSSRQLRLFLQLRRKC